MKSIDWAFLPYLEQAQLLIEPCRHQQLAVGMEVHALDHRRRRLRLVCILHARHLDQPSGKQRPAAPRQQPARGAQQRRGVLVFVVVARGAGRFGIAVGLAAGAVLAGGGCPAFLLLRDDSGGGGLARQWCINERHAAKHKSCWISGTAVAWCCGRPRKELLPRACVRR